MHLLKPSEILRLTINADNYYRKKYGHNINIDDTEPPQELYNLSQIRFGLNHWLYELPTIVSNVSVKIINKDRLKFRQRFIDITDDTITDFENILIAGGAVGSIIFDNPIEDIDIFIYGLELTPANKKVYHIVHQIVSGKKWEKLKIINSKHCITIVTPTIKFQIILRLYKSIGEILYGFDLGSCAVGFDGKDVYFTALAQFSFEYLCNYVDLSRRSTTFEQRLIKYLGRGFSIILPEFDMSKLSTRNIRYGINEICELPLIVFTYDIVTYNRIHLCDIITNFGKKSDYLDYTFRKSINCEQATAKHYNKPYKFIFIMNRAHGINLINIIYIDRLTINPGTQINGSINPAVITGKDWYGNYYKS